MPDLAAPVLTPEIQQHLAMAFGEPVPAPATDPAAAPAQPEGGEPASTAPQEGATSTSTANNQPTNQQPAAEEGVLYFHPDEYLKEHLGFENWETAKAQIQELQQKANTPAEIKFANDTAKRWFEYFSNGDEDSLYKSLHARQQVRGVESMGDEQKMKLFIKMNNPMFDQELVDYQYQKDYGFDDSAFKDENGVIVDQLGYRHAKVGALQRMQSDLARANEYFNDYRSKIELPEINRQAAAPAVDEAYEGYKARTANATQAYETTIAPALKALKEADMNMAFKINDPDNQMVFDFGITVDKPDFDSALDDALFYSDYVEKTFYDEKGNFKPERLARAVLLERNFDKYAQTIARQAVNAERKRVIEKEAPSGLQKQFTNVSQEAMNELDQRMKMAFSV